LIDPFHPGPPPPIHPPISIPDLLSFCSNRTVVAIALLAPPHSTLSFRSIFCVIHGTIEFFAISFLTYLPGSAALSRPAFAINSVPLRRDLDRPTDHPTNQPANQTTDRLQPIARPRRRFKRTALVDVHGHLDRRSFTPSLKPIPRSRVQSGRTPAPIYRLCHVRNGSGRRPRQRK
jgi:hypothetical protein